jgi:hypothetical protein
MTQATSKLGLNDTRLVRLLTDLAVFDMAFPPKNFAERLGGAINFGDSMRLASFHDELREMIYEPSPTSIGRLQEEVLRVRSALVLAVVESFTPHRGSARLKLPTIEAGVPPDQSTAFEPYHRFYAAHQREFESEIHALQLRVRGLACGFSAELGQLTAMDEAMRSIFSMHTRRSLALIPQLLGKRFAFLLQEHRSHEQKSGDEVNGDQPKEGVLDGSTQPDGWLDEFYEEMQELLLAELELRLMPVLALVEAVDEEVNRK